MPSFPPQWGSDELSQFFDGAIGNIAAAFEHLPQECDRLRRIHLAFRQPSRQPIGGDEEIAPVFLMRRAHAGFLGAAKLTLAGMPPEAYAVQRGVLEAAVYAAHIGRDHQRAITWLNRIKDDQARRAARREFQWQRVLHSAREVDAEAGQAADELYEHCIDYGGHPNSEAILSLLERPEGGLDREAAVTDWFEFAYLITGERPQYALCLRTLAQVGICALCFFRAHMADHFRKSGVYDEVDRLKAGL